MLKPFFYALAAWAETFSYYYAADSHNFFVAINRWWLTCHDPHVNHESSLEPNDLDEFDDDYY